MILLNEETWPLKDAQMSVAISSMPTTIVRMLREDVEVQRLAKTYNGMQLYKEFRKHLGMHEHSLHHQTLCYALLIALREHPEFSKVRKMRKPPQWQGWIVEIYKNLNSIIDRSIT